MTYRKITKEEILAVIVYAKSRRNLVELLKLPQNGNTNKYVKSLLLEYRIVEEDYYNWKQKRTLIGLVTREELSQAVKHSNTFKEVLERIGCENPVGSSYRILKDKLEAFSIDTSHMTHQSKVSYKVHTNEAVFCENSKVSQSCLRDRVLKNNLIEYKCAICGMPPLWNEKPLTLTLDHKNGNRTDNRLENLQFVCPNCDKQQETFGAYNKIRYYSFKSAHKKKNTCDNCGKEISYKATYCKGCASVHRRKTERPTKEELKTLIMSHSILFISKRYNVSGNAVRKWLKSYGLPCKQKEIRSLKEQDKAL